MQVIDFIRKKNAIIHNYTGLTLIPESQIKDIEIETPLNINGDDFDICPYCQVYYNPIINGYGDDACKGCPMHEAGNGCTRDHKPQETTYERVTELCESMSINHNANPWYNELVDLINVFNESYFEGNDDR